MLRARNRGRGGVVTSSVITGARKMAIIGDSITAQCIVSSKYPVGYTTAVTQANPAQATLSGHGFVNSDQIFFWGVNSMTQLNEQNYTATVIDANNFTLGVDSTGYTAFSGTGKAFAMYDISYGRSMAGYMTRFLQYMKQRFDYQMRWDRGISSETSTNIVNRLASSLPTGKGITDVIVLCGTNDCNSSVVLSTFESNINTIISYITGTLGARVILCTVPPVDSNTAPQKTLKLDYNTMIRSKAAPNVTIADIYAAVADGSGNWLTGYSSDGTHPIQAGAQAMSQVLVDACKPVYGLGTWSLNADNKVINPTLSGTGGTATGFINSGIASSYDTTVFGGSTNKGTVSKNGSDQQVLSWAFDGSEVANSGMTLGQSVNFTTAGYSVGDWITGQIEVTVDSYTGATNGMIELSGGIITSGTARSYVDAGVISGSPVNPLIPANLVSASSSNRLILQVEPFRVLTGMTAGRIRLQLRFNPTLGANSGQITIYGMQMYKTTSPYA